MPRCLGAVYDALHCPNTRREFSVTCRHPDGRASAVALVLMCRKCIGRRQRQVCGVSIGRLLLVLDIKVRCLDGKHQYQRRAADESTALLLYSHVGHTTGYAMYVDKE